MTKLSSFRWFLVFFLAAGLLASAAGSMAASRIYRTVDEHGNVVFTDVPPKEGERSEAVDIETPNTFDDTAAFPEPESQATRTWTGADSESSDEEPPPFQYTSVAIVKPQDDEAVRANPGNIDVDVLVEPDLRGTDVVRVLLDGVPAQEGNQTSFVLENVDRGTHALHAEVADGQGRVLKASQPITFHVLRAVAPRPTPKPN